jgi:hypothetical protein
VIIQSNQKLSTKPAPPTTQFRNFLILNLCSFHFHYVAIILHLWLMKFSMPVNLTYLIFPNIFRVCERAFECHKRGITRKMLDASEFHCFHEYSFNLNVSNSNHTRVFKQRQLERVSVCTIHSSYSDVFEEFKLKCNEKICNVMIVVYA